MSLPARWLIALVLLLLTAGGGYWAGDHQRNNAWLAKQAKVRQDAHKKYEEEVDRGVKAAGNYLDELREKDDQYAELENKFEKMRRSMPIVVPAASGTPHAAAAGSEPDLAQAGAPQCIQIAVRPELSLGAVWMWNSALAGADVPAGACGADAAPAQACAAASGLTVDDAWRNQSVNAKSCADDRLRYDRLIDFLQNRTPPQRAPSQRAP